ncbi:MAG: pseudouridine synthase [Planctomycetaceae bacterium]|nr:pseudouridine synthase [Planctomycetaceae bacterium]
MGKLLLLNKPFKVLCKFTDEKDRPTLAEYCKIPGVYAAGRLDFDSEGLLLLTDQGWLQSLISHPKYKLPKTYYVQVEGDITDQAIKALAKGVKLKDGLTKPAVAKKVDEPWWLWERTPPIRERKEIPTSWVELTIREGRNRQVRRMTAAVDFPTLRLIRGSIGPWSLNELQSGELTEVSAPKNREAAEKLFAQWVSEAPKKSRPRRRR